MPPRTFPLPDCLGKAVWRTCSVGGCAFLGGPIEPFALRRDVPNSPEPHLRGMFLFSFDRQAPNRLGRPQLAKYESRK
jgi:hypothetical protein